MKTCPRCNHSGEYRANDKIYRYVGGRKQLGFTCSVCDGAFIDTTGEHKPPIKERVRKSRRSPSFTMPPPRETGAKINEPAFAIAAEPSVKFVPTLSASEVPAERESVKWNDERRMERVIQRTMARVRREEFKKNTDLLKKSFPVNIRVKDSTTGN